MYMNQKPITLASTTFTNFAGVNAFYFVCMAFPPDPPTVGPASRRGRVLAVHDRHQHDLQGFARAAGAGGLSRCSSEPFGVRCSRRGTAACFCCYLCCPRRRSRNGDGGGQRYTFNWHHEESLTAVSTLCAERQLCARSDTISPLLAFDGRHRCLR